MTRRATIPTQRAEYRSVPTVTLARDVSGYAIFATGEAGEAHVMAHRLRDQSRIAAGRRWLAVRPLRFEAAEHAESERSGHGAKL